MQCTAQCMVSTASDSSRGRWEFIPSDPLRVQYAADMVLWPSTHIQLHMLGPSACSGTICGLQRHKHASSTGFVLSHCLRTARDSAEAGQDVLHGSSAQACAAGLSPCWQQAQRQPPKPASGLWTAQTSAQPRRAACQGRSLACPMTRM